jgi:hypothetical protein
MRAAPPPRASLLQPWRRRPGRQACGSARTSRDGPRFNDRLRPGADFRAAERPRRQVQRRRRSPGKPGAMLSQAARGGAGFLFASGNPHHAIQRAIPADIWVHPKMIGATRTAAKTGRHELGHSRRHGTSCAPLASGTAAARSAGSSRSACRIPPVLAPAAGSAGRAASARRWFAGARRPEEASDVPWFGGEGHIVHDLDPRSSLLSPLTTIGQGNAVQRDGLGRRRLAGDP